MKKKHKIPWPTKAAMEQIYQMKLWGGSTYDFYSGDGSYHTKITQPYIKEVQKFLGTFQKPIVVCDLGCGDFNIGKDLFNYSKYYYALDIVETLINRNIEKFKASNLEFNCVDIANEELPKADCAIVRQVLQHLSNREVEQVIEKLKKFQYIILTEHIPSTEFTSNKDIISGQGIRLKKNSGLDILKPPFNFKPKKTKELLVTELENDKGIIVTKLFIT